MKEQILSLVVEAAAATSGLLEEPLELERGADTRLFGEQGPLDSLSLVSLITDVEQAVEQELGVSIVIASARALSRARSPFASIGALVDYVLELLEERRACSR